VLFLTSTTKTEDYENILPWIWAGCGIKGNEMCCSGLRGLLGWHHEIYYCEVMWRMLRLRRHCLEIFPIWGAGPLKQWRKLPCTCW
jgi:hypothetical protein